MPALFGLPWVKSSAPTWINGLTSDLMNRNDPGEHFWLAGARILGTSAFPVLAQQICPHATAILSDCSSLPAASSVCVVTSTAKSYFTESQGNCYLNHYSYCFHRDFESLLTDDDQFALLNYPQTLNVRKLLAALHHKWSATLTSLKISLRTLNVPQPLAVVTTNVTRWTE